MERKSGGQFAPNLGGQFKPKFTGHFAPKSGGQFDRFFQLIFIVLSFTIILLVFKSYADSTCFSFSRFITNFLFSF